MNDLQYVLCNVAIYFSYHLSKHYFPVNSGNIKHIMSESENLQLEANPGRHRGSGELCTALLKGISGIRAGNAREAFYYMKIAAIMLLVIGGDFILDKLWNYSIKSFRSPPRFDHITTSTGPAVVVNKHEKNVTPSVILIVIGLSVYELLLRSAHGIFVHCVLEYLYECIFILHSSFNQKTNIYFCSFSFD